MLNVSYNKTMATAKTETELHLFKYALHNQVKQSHTSLHKQRYQIHASKVSPLPWPFFASKRVPRKACQQLRAPYSILQCQMYYLDTSIVFLGVIWGYIENLLKYPRGPGPAPPYPVRLYFSWNFDMGYSDIFSPKESISELRIIKFNVKLRNCPWQPYF